MAIPAEEARTDAGEGSGDLADELGADPQALRDYITEQADRNAEIDAFLGVLVGAAKRIVQSAEGLRSR